MRKVKSVILSNDALGERISAIYAVIDEKSGKIIADDKRLEKVIMSKKSTFKDLLQYAQDFIDQDELNSMPKEEVEPVIDDGTKKDTK